MYKCEHLEYNKEFFILIKDSCLKDLHILAYEIIRFLKIIFF